MNKAYLDDPVVAPNPVFHMVVWLAVIWFMVWSVGFMWRRLGYLRYPPELEDETRRHNSPQLKILNVCVNCRCKGKGSNHISNPDSDTANTGENSQSAQLQDHINELMQRLRTSEAYVAKLQVDLESSRASVKSLQEMEVLQELKDAKAKIHELETSFAKQQHALEKEQAHVKGWKARLDKECKHSEQLREELEIVKDKNSSVAQQCNALQESNSKLESDLLGLVKKLKTSKNEIESQATQLNTANRSLKSSQEGVKDQVETVRKHEKEKAEKEIINLRADNERLRQELTNATGQAQLHQNQATAGNEKQQNANKQISDLNAEVKTLTGQLKINEAKSKAAISAQKKSKENLVEAQKENAALRNRVTELDQTITTLQQERDSAQNEINSKEIPAEVQEENATLRKKVSELEKSNATLEQERDSAESEVKSRANLEEAQKENAVLHNKVTELEQSNETLVQERDSAQDEVKSLGDRNIELQSRQESIANGAPSKDLKEAQNQVQELQAKVKEDDERFKDLNHEYNELEQEKVDLEDAKENAEKEMEQLRLQIVEKNESIEQAQAQMGEYQNQLKIKGKNEMKMATDLAKCQKERDALLQAMEEAENEKARHKSGSSEAAKAITNIPGISTSKFKGSTGPASNHPLKTDGKSSTKASSSRPIAPMRPRKTQPSTTQSPQPPKTDNQVSAKPSSKATAISNRPIAPARGRKKQLTTNQSSQPPTTTEVEPSNTKKQLEKQPEQQGKQESPRASGLYRTAAPGQKEASKSESIQDSEARTISDLPNNVPSLSVKTEPLVQKGAGESKEGSSSKTKPPDASPAVDRYVLAPPQETSGPGIFETLGKNAGTQQSSSSTAAGNQPSRPARVQQPSTGEPMDFKLTGQQLFPPFGWGKETAPVGGSTGEVPTIDEKPKTKSRGRRALLNRTRRTTPHAEAEAEVEREGQERTKRNRTAPTADVLGSSKGTAPKSSTPKPTSRNQRAQSGPSSNPPVQSAAPSSSSFLFGQLANNTFGPLPAPPSSFTFGGQPSFTFGVPQPNTQPDSQPPTHSNLVAPEAAAASLPHSQPNTALLSGQNDAKTGPPSTPNVLVGYNSDTSSESASQENLNPYEDDEGEETVEQLEEQLKRIEKEEQEQKEIRRLRQQVVDANNERIRKASEARAARPRSKEPLDYDGGGESSRQSDYPNQNYAGGGPLGHPGYPSYAGGQSSGQSGYPIYTTGSTRSRRPPWGAGGNYAGGLSHGYRNYPPTRASNPARADERLRSMMSASQQGIDNMEELYSSDYPQTRYSGLGYQTQNFGDDDDLDPDEPFTASPLGTDAGPAWGTSDAIPQGDSGGDMEVDQPGSDAGGNAGRVLDGDFMEESPSNAGGAATGVGVPMSTKDILGEFNKGFDDEFDDDGGEMNNSDGNADAWSDHQQEVELPASLFQSEFPVLDADDDGYQPSRRGSLREEPSSDDEDAGPTKWGQRW
jgi:hypothetical protein